MKKVLAVALSIAFLGSAQAASTFDGPYVGLTIGDYSGDSEMSEGYDFFFGDGPFGSDSFFGPGFLGVDGGFSTDLGSGNHLGGVFGYAKTFNRFHLGAELQYQSNLGSTDYSGSAEEYSSDSGSLGVGVNVGIELKSALTVSLLPGFLVTPDTLIYGRIGRGSMETSYKYGINYSGSSIDGEDSIENGGSFSFSNAGTTDVNATVFGFGVKHAVSETVSMSIEYKKITADKVNIDNGFVEFETEITGVEAGLQYRF